MADVLTVEWRREMGVRISAWKKVEGGLTSCDVDDSLAVSFDVSYPGAYCGMPMSFETLYMAERVAHALAVCFVAGGNAKMWALRNFMGIKS